MGAMKREEATPVALAISIINFEEYRVFIIIF
jgi:hypothetical protein